MPTRGYTDKLTGRMKKSISDFVFNRCGIGPKISFYRTSETAPWKYFWIGFLGIHSALSPNTLMHCSPQRYVLSCQDAAYYESQIRSILILSGKQVSTPLRSNRMMYSHIGTLPEKLGTIPRVLTCSSPIRCSSTWSFISSTICKSQTWSLHRYWTPRLASYHSVNRPEAVKWTFAAAVILGKLLNFFENKAAGVFLPASGEQLGILLRSAARKRLACRMIPPSRL